VCAPAYPHAQKKYQHRTMDDGLILVALVCCPSYADQYDQKDNGLDAWIPHRPPCLILNQEAGNIIGRPEAEVDWQVAYDHCHIADEYHC
jgi:hypothetical protein